MRWLNGTLLLLIFLLTGSSWAQAKQGDDVTLRLKTQAYRFYYGIGVPVDYARAFDLYRLAAERGDTEAQFVTGGMLYQGQGMDPDKQNAFKWLLRAAEKGKVSPESLAIIGSMYLSGSAVPQNYLEAKKWLSSGAQLGNIAALNDLAYLYYNGLGGDRDYKKALELYEKAALQGDILAQANTGLMYATGTGTSTDKARGYAWYSLAASQGNTVAAINRNNLMVDMSWEELNRAQAISLELYRQVEKISEPRLIKPDFKE